MDKKAKKYNNTKIAVGIIKGVLGFILLFLFLKSGISSKLVQYISRTVQNPYLILIVFAFVVFLASEIIFFPFDFYTEFYLEHKYNLSEQKFSSWIWKNLKAFFVGILIFVPLLIAFYYLLLHTGNLWWFYFAIILFFFSVVLAQIMPVLILPIFYKLIPIDDETLKTELTEIVKKEGLKIKDIFKFDMSKETKKANAALVGFGKTKRIILGDTLLNNFTPEEITTVLAHEIGHYKRKHVLKNILLSTAFSFVTLYLISYFYELTLPFFGFNNITQIDALPLLVLIAMVIGLITTPLMNKISRGFEFEADEYAVISTGKADVFANTLLKLNEINLGDEDPHPLIEFFFYGHPSIKRRIKFVKSLKG